MGLEEDFESAQERINTLTKRPSNEEFLELYALFKQATKGDNDTKKPGMFDMKGQFKWKAWNSKKGLSSDKAKQEYISLVDNLLKKYK